MLKKHPILLAAIALVLIALAIPGVRIYHHIELPDIDKNRIVSSTKFSLMPPFIVTKTDITIEDGIYSPVWYKGVGRALREARLGDEVVFHLSGHGGDVDTLLQLVNQVKQSSAVVTMSIEAPVYSAHAYLALFGDRIVMGKYSFLMFHFSSILDLDCSTQKGLDRGQPRKEKCEQYKLANIQVVNKLLLDAPILNPQEKAAIGHGGDVYISYEDLKTRGYLQ
jgi:hypothetical protein